MHILYAFGWNEDGQCGVASKKDQKGINYPTPIKFPQKIDIISVCAGSRHTMALSACGSVFSWGYGRQGQLGHGIDENANFPEKIVALNGIHVTAVSAGGMHSGCIDKDNNCYTWGSSTCGQLGLGKDILDFVLTPQLVFLVDEEVYPQFKSPLKVNKLSCGGLHTAAIDLNGDVYCWGKADSGQTGYAKWYFDFSPGVAVPKKVEGGFECKAVEVSCGGFHTLILTERGRVYAMGKEDFGMLGTNLSKDSMSIGAEVPTLVDALKDLHVVAVRAGGWHSTFLTDDGQLFSCGKGEYGRLGVGSEKSKIEPTLVNCCQRGISEHPGTAAPFHGNNTPLSPGGTNAKSRKMFQEEEDEFFVNNSYTIAGMSAGGSHTVWYTTHGDIYSVGRVDGGRLGMGSCSNSAVKVDRTILPTKITHNFYHANKAKIVRVSAGGSHTTVLMEYPEIRGDAREALFMMEIERSSEGK